jgi:tRNA(Ile)-lysidine synthase
MSLPDRFTAYIQTNALCGADERLLLAVSGGVDSIAMAHLFREAGYRFGIAHCNFKLRDEASDGDEQFVGALAAAWDVPFYTTQFETAAYASEKGISIQMAARDLRYAFFESVRKTEGYDRIATGHNLNDSIETALFNFTRGTGLRGLAGIQPVHGRVIRPIMFASRQEIEAYAVENDIPWREDRSNESDDYARNFIRHHVIRQLEILNPGFLETAGRNLGRLRGADANFNYLVAAQFGEAPHKIEKAGILKFPAPVQILRMILRPFGFTEEQCRQMCLSLAESGQEWFSPAGYRLISDRTQLLVTSVHTAAIVRIPVEENDLMVSLPGGVRLFLTRQEPGAAYPDGISAALVDADKLQFPLTLRPWLPGDAFQPFGMGGKHQKLQDYFTNQKLSRLDKEEVWVLENGDGAIIWVVGFRLDERFKVNPATQNSLKISRVDPN